MIDHNRLAVRVERVNEIDKDQCLDYKQKIEYEGIEIYCVVLTDKLISPIKIEYRSSNSLTTYHQDNYED